MEVIILFAVACVYFLIFIYYTINYLWAGMHFIDSVDYGLRVIGTVVVPWTKAVLLLAAPFYIWFKFIQ